MEEGAGKPVARAQQEFEAHITSTRGKLHTSSFFSSSFCNFLNIIAFFLSFFSRQDSGIHQFLTRTISPCGPGPGPVGHVMSPVTRERL
jgi:hypothetical protein